MREQVAAIAAAVGADVRLEELRPLPTVEEVTGRPARSFAQWALDHAGDFH